MTHQISAATHTAGEIKVTLDEWRAKALYIVLIVVAIAGLPAYVSPVINANQVTPLLWVYLLVYFAFVGLAVLPGLDVRLRGWAFFFLAYANAVASFARVGLAGSGRLYLMAIPVLATILIGSWAGYVTAALSLVIYAVFTALAQSGVLSAWMTVPDNPVTFGFWFEAGAALLVFLMTLLFLVERFYHLHVQTLAASCQAGAELERLTQALQEREERFSLAMQGANDGLWDWNLKTNEVYYSPRWKGMLGYADDEVEPRFSAWERLVHPDDLAQAVQVVQDFVASRADKYEVEFRMLHKDGHYVDVLSRAFGARETPGGPIVRLVGTYVDLSERKRVEAALRDSEDKFRRMVEFANVGIAITQDTRFRFVNPCYAAMLGYAADEMLGTEFMGYCAPEERDRLVGFHAKRIKGEPAPTRYETAVLRKDGQRVFVDVSAGLIPHEGRPASFIYLVDMTERKRVEEALRASEAELRALFAAMTDVILVLDAQGRYLKVAPTNPALLYRPVAALEGKTLHELFQQPQADFFLDHVRRALESNRPVNFEYSLNLEGKRTWFAATVSPMLADRVIWVARDITERKRAEQALQERLAFERVITSISTEFINLGPDEIDAGILHALQVIGEFTGDDRSYVFRFSEDGTTMDNTHEWCRADIEPQKQNLQAQSVDILGWSVAKIKRLEVVHIPRVAELPAEASVDREQMQGQDIQSLILVPMVYRGKAVAFVGFDSVRRERTWTEDDIALLRIVGEIFANALEHKRAQEALRNSEMWFRAVFEAAPIGIHVTSWEGRLAEGEKHKLEANRAYQQMLGYTGGEFARMRLEEFSYPEDAVADRALYSELVSGKRERYQLEKRYIAKDGRVFWGRYSASAVRGQDGQLRLMIGTVENIEEQKQAQQALQTAYQTLERRVEERTRELATLNAIAAVVSRSLDLRDILSDALDKTLEITQMGCGGSYRLEGEGDEAYLNPLVYRGLSDEFVRFARRLPLPGSGVQVAARTGQPLVWEVTNSPADPNMRQALTREGVELVVSVPLMAKGRLVGAIQLGARGVRSFAPEELSLLAAIGQQVGMAVENARLYEQAQQSATYAERSRLARELHDSVTQSLYSLTLYAEAAARMMQDGEHAQAADALREMRDTAQEALREMRLLIFQLRPPALEKSGLAAALQARLDAVESRGGIRAKLLVESASGAEQLPLLVQEELYHIAQEALNNALKHAHPRQVRVGLRFNPDAVHLEISDDGAGFALESIQEGGGLGLPGMRERAERIGADLRIESAPGQGTQVMVRAPHTPKTEEAR